MIGLAVGGALALASTSASTVWVAHADSYACYFPNVLWQQTGDSFPSDGDIPAATVKDNECDGGTNTGTADGNVYDQYEYIASVGQTEYDVNQTERAWVCGTEQTPRAGDSTGTLDDTTQWWNYGPWNGHQCGIQFDQTVNIETTAGEKWYQYTSDQSSWGTCDGAQTSSCPVGGT